MTRSYNRPDFARIRAIPIERVCELLQLDLKKKGVAYRGKCPLCDHPSPRAFVVTPLPTNRFWCFGRCQSGGDGLELFARVRQLTVYQAGCELARDFNSS